MSSLVSVDKNEDEAIMVSQETWLPLTPIHASQINVNKSQVSSVTHKDEFRFWTKFALIICYRKLTLNIM